MDSVTNNYQAMRFIIIEILYQPVTYLFFEIPFTNFLRITEVSDGTNINSVIDTTNEIENPNGELFTVLQQLSYSDCCYLCEFRETVMICQKVEYARSYN